MRNSKVFNLVLALMVGFVFAVPSLAQEKEKSATQITVEAGKKQKISGIVVRREGNDLVVRDRAKAEFKVNLADTTKIEERKSNPFRGAKKYEAASIVRGLWVEVEGRGADSGAIIADKVKFTETEFRDASSLEARVDPVEDRVTETEGRMTQAEQNAQRLSGQIEELSAVANTARGGAKAAQETADKALSEVNAANERINVTNQRVAAVDERVTSVDNRLNAVDEYEAKNSTNINFRVGSAVLSKDAKASLDELAAQAKNEKGFVIQVAGFASADGGKEYNRRLSERRADAVIRYLMENHDIPQRRIITPYGYGELKPAADNTTRDGRKQNRRVEVAILVSKGLVTPASASADAQRQRTSNQQ
jgi:outer membrane protein OmpA-like peptidoglycan-associated protein